MWYNYFGRGDYMAYGIIYKIENTQNNKVYIGVTVNKRGFNGRYSAKGKGIERVYNFYTYQLKNKQFCNVHLLNSIKKYGFENFKIHECIDTAETKEELQRKEKEWIALYQSNNLNNGYNRTAGGDSFLSGKDHPKYNSMECICENCGKVFSRIPSHVNIHIRSYCSKKCASVGQSVNYSGENNWFYKQKQINCNYCKKILMRPPSYIHDLNFCDMKCQGKYYSKSLKGENNPNYGNKGKISGSKNGRRS